MNVKVSAEDFRNALNKVLSVVDKRSSRPILGYSLVTIKPGKLEISATDLEVSAKISVESVSEESGNFCVNAKNLFDILKEMPDETIDLTLDPTKNNLNIQCKSIKYNLLVYNTEDFPHLVFGNSQNEFEIDSALLSEIISKTNHAISNDETRHYLNGVFIQDVQGKLRTVATDGHRLALYDSDVDHKGIDTLINGIIIPKKGISELKRLSESFQGEKISLSVDESFLYAAAGEKYFISVRLIAREYPKYQAVIPSKTTFTLMTDRDTLFNAIRRIKIMSNEKSNGVRVKLSNNEILLTANHPSLGNAQERIDVDYDGKEMEIGFNAKYLIDTLSSFEPGEVAIELNNELSPVLMKSSNSPNYLGIIMPLKL